MAGHLLEVRNLSVRFHTARGSVDAVKNVSWHVDRGETLAILGEVGLGQVGLLLGDHEPDRLPPGEITSGEVLFDGRDLLKHVAARAPRDQRQADRDDLPGPAQPPEPGLHRRLAAERGDAGSRHDRGAGRGAGARPDAPGRHPRARRIDATSTRTSSPAASASA